MVYIFFLEFIIFKEYIVSFRTSIEMKKILENIDPKLKEIFVPS